jgi:hypothetical protein
MSSSPLHWLEEHQKVGGEGRESHGRRRKGEQTSSAYIDHDRRLTLSYLGASLEPMLKDHRASVFLALTVALTITVIWGP